MDRRHFVTAAATAAAVSGMSKAQDVAAPATAFKLKYAPHFGMFKNLAGSDDPIAQIQFMHAQGFRAMEDNGMKGKSPELQEKIGAELQRLGMTMGVFVALAEFKQPTFVRPTDESRQKWLKDLTDSVDVAKRCGARWMTVVPGGFDPGLEWDYQTANVVEMLKRGAEILEPHNLTMVLEPLNPWKNHAGVFLTKVPQAYLICKAVDSPAVKILFDLYHQQITEGNLIPNIDLAWSEIGYFQQGDNPGRKEPGTGEINYRNVFRHLHSKGWDGVCGMEHGNSKPGAEGEQMVIDAYRGVDDF